MQEIRKGKEKENTKRDDVSEDEAEKDYFVGRYMPDFVGTITLSVRKKQLSPLDVEESPTMMTQSGSVSHPLSLCHSH